MGHHDAAILVVDDNENNRELLVRRLAKEGYANVVLAEDGRAALDRLIEKPFDLVLLDIMMTNLNGYEVLEEMKADPGLRDIPVLVISAVQETKTVVQCLELGADDYLTKPSTRRSCVPVSVHALRNGGFGRRKPTTPGR